MSAVYSWIFQLPAKMRKNAFFSSAAKKQLQGLGLGVGQALREGEEFVGRKECLGYLVIGRFGLADIGKPRRFLCRTGPPMEQVLIERVDLDAAMFAGFPDCFGHLVTRSAVLQEMKKPIVADNVGSAVQDRTIKISDVSRRYSLLDG